jgi:hypothetical protein
MPRPLAAPRDRSNVPRAEGAVPRSLIGTVAVAVGEVRDLELVPNGGERWGAVRPLNGGVCRSRCAHSCHRELGRAGNLGCSLVSGLFAGSQKSVWTACFSKKSIESSCLSAANATATRKSQSGVAHLGHRGVELSHRLND